MQLETKCGTTKPSIENVVNLGDPNIKDETLVAQAVRGSSAAFETLFQRYQQKMFRVALSRLQNPEDAEDAVQQTFQQAFVHLKSFQGQSRFSTWLTRIAINEALMLLRKRRPGHLSIEGHQSVDEESFALEIKDPAITPEEQYGQKELRNVLTGAIDELRPILKTVVNLAEIGELSTRKTADTLGVRVGTVKARTFRARRLLRDKISKRLGARAGKVSAALFSVSQTSRATQPIRLCLPPAPPSSLLSGGAAVALFVGRAICPARRIFMWIVRVALDRPYTFIVLALLILLMSPVVLLRTPTDIFPNIDIPVVAVAWQYTGLNPEEMEGRVTTVYERILTTTVDNIQHIESTTVNGQAIVKIFLQPNSSLENANAQITAVSQTILRQLPPGALPPLIINFTAPPASRFSS